MRLDMTGLCWALVAAGLVAVSPVLAQDETGSDEFDCSRVGKLFEDATREELRDAPLHVRSTKLYFSQELYEKAAREAELAVHLDATDPEPFMRLGMAYARLGCFEAAGQAFADGLALCDHSPRMRSKCEDLAIGSNRNFFWQEEFKAAGDLFDQGRFEEAAQRYRNAIAVDDSEDRAWLNLGLTHANLADYDQAVDALAMAHELDPTDERTTEFYRKTLQSKAIEEYSASAEPVTSDPAQARQLVESALARLDIALSLDPPAAERMGYLDNKSIILRFLADLHEQVEEGSGRDTFAAAIEARRSAAVARSEAVAAGSVDAADADEARRDNLLFTIICFDAMGEVDSTLIYAKRVIDLDPTQAEGYSFVASALNTKGDKQESIRYLLMNFCLSERGKKVDDVNAHFIDLLNSYEATDEIIMASITNPETPTEIRIYADGSHVYESWLFWSEGYANCYYDGKNLGKVEFEPVPTP